VETILQTSCSLLHVYFLASNPVTRVRKSEKEGRTCIGQGCVCETYITPRYVGPSARP